MTPRALAVAIIIALPVLPALGQTAPDPSSLLEQANAAFEAGNTEQAIALLEPIRQWDEPPAPALAILGALYLEAGRAQAAFDLLAPLAAVEPNSAVLYNAGRAAVRTGRLEAGETYLSRSLELVPGGPAARELGFLRTRQGRIDEAYDLLLPWARANPSDGDGRLAAALLAIKIGRLLEADELLTGLPQENPRVQLLRGELLLRRGEAESALVTLRPLLDGPSPAVDLEARRTMAEAYLETNQAREALALLAGRGNDDPGIVLLRARAQRRTGGTSDALKSLAPLAGGLTGGGQLPYSPALAADVAFDYGILLIVSERPVEAVAYLELVTPLDAGDPDGWQALARALEAAGRNEEAAAAQRRFETLARGETTPGPGGSQPSLGGQSLDSQRSPEEALQAARRAVAAAPQDLQLRLQEAQLLLSLGRHQEALETAGAVVAMDEQSADAFYLRGVANMALQQAAAAERDFRRALVLAPDHTAALSDLAVLLTSRGEREEARALLQRVLELRPDDSVAARNLERLEQEAGGGG